MSLVWIQFFISLLLTLLLELPFAALFGARGKDFLLFLLVNVLTNPAVVLVSLITDYHTGVQILLEVIVIFTEGWYYKRYAQSIRFCWGCALAANCFSYGMGLLINWI